MRPNCTPALNLPLSWALLAAVIPATGAPVAHLDKLKDPCLETTLVAAGKPAAVIVPGEGDELATLAEQVRAAIKAAQGVDLPIVSAAQVTDEVLREKHCLALGDCTSNKLIGRLYAMRLCFVDSVNPGRGAADPGFDRDANDDGLPDLWSFSTPTGLSHELHLDDKVFRSGPHSVRIAGREHEGDARACVMRNLEVVPGRRYRMTLWYRADLPPTGHGTFHVDFYRNGAPAERLGIEAKDLGPVGQWTEVVNEFTVPAGTDFGRVLLYLHGEGTLWYDDVALCEAGSPTNLLAVGNTGAVVRTVHDPFGYRRNVIVLGASEPAGLQRAVELFSTHLRQQPLPNLRDLEIGDSARYQGVVPSAGPTDESLIKQAEAAKVRVDSNAFVPVRDTMQGTKSIARNWYLTGDDQWAKLYAAIWRVILDSPASNAHGPMEWTFNTLEGWDLMDECPALPDALKLEIVNRLLEIGVRNEERYGRNVQNVKDRLIVDGHQLDQGLCLYMHGVYFDKYYGINGHWKTMAQPLIELGQQTPRVHDSYAYGPILGNDFLSEYALKTGDMTYFENGNCRKQVEWQRLCSDNLGAGGTFGDDGAWRGSVPTGLFYKANWFYRDDTMKWFLRGDRPPVGLFANDRPATEPRWLLGVASVPLDERLYQVAAATKRDPEAAKWSPDMAPQDKAFDKLAFRSGFGERDAYLLLDGVSVLSHGHQDGNSILRFTDNGRLFLTEGHYVEIAPQRHNTLLVSRNGESWAPPPLTSLELKANLAETCLVQTRTQAYNGLDWRRNVMRLTEGVFVVTDQVTAREEGDYGLDLLWRTLGDPTLAADGAFSVDQRGESMTLTRTDTFEVWVRELLDCHGANYYGSYPYCTDGMVKELHQTQTARLQAGEGYTFQNVVRTHKTGEPPALARRLSETALLLTAGTDRAIVGVGSPTFDGGPDTDAVQWVVWQSGEVALGQTTRFRWGDIALATDSPCSLELNAPAGTLTAAIDDAAGTAYKLTVGDHKVEDLLKSGAVALPFKATPAFGALFDALVRTAAAPVAAPAPNRAGDQAAPSPKVLWRAPLPPQRKLVTAEPGTRVLCTPDPLPFSTWTRDYKIDPQTLAYQWDSLVLWKEGEVAEVTIQLPQKRPLSKVAVRTMWTTNSAAGISYRLGKLSVSAADNAGGPWQELKTFAETGRHEVPSYPEYTVDTPGLQAQFLRVHAEPEQGCALFLKGIRAWGEPETGVQGDPRIQRWATGPVTALCAGKLTGGKADCVLYGCRDGRLVALDRGKELWAVETGAQINALAAGDLTGDGQPEVLVGTNGQRLLCLDATGKELWRKEFPAFWGRLGNVMWVAVGDVDGDGANEIVLSCENWHYYCLDRQGNQVWSFEIEHSGLEGALGDVNGDGKLETLCGQEYYGWDVLSHEGKRLFAVSGPGPITTAALTEDVTGDGVAEAIFGAQTNGVYVRNGKGGKVFDGNVGGFVNDLAVLKTGAGNLLVAAADSFHLNLVAFRREGAAAWRKTLRGTPLQLAVAGGAIAIGCADGALRIVNSEGETVQSADLAGPVANVVAADADGDGVAEICAAGDGELVAYELR